MPLKNGRLSHQERAFIGHMVDAGNATEAARRAGYRQPSSRGSDLMRRPAIVAEVQAQVTHRLQTEGYEVGVGMLIKIARDETAPKAPRVMAASNLVKLAMNLGSDARPKELHEMNRAELAAAADKARAYLAELEAPVIEGEALPASGIFD